MKGEPTVIEKFQAENDRLLKEAAQVDREYKAKIEDLHKKLEGIRSKQERVAAAVAASIADFERTEAEIKDSELAKMSEQSQLEQDFQAGKIGAGEYFQKHVSEQDLAASARKAAAEKTDFLLRAVRIKAAEALALDAEEARCEWEIYAISCYEANGLIEKLRAQLKSLEAVSNFGSVSYAEERMKATQAVVDRARGEATTGYIWRDVTLETAKRMRFDAGIPEAELPALQGIIEQLEGRPGDRVAIRFDPYHKPALSIFIWEN